VRCVPPDSSGFVPPRLGARLPFYRPRGRRVTCTPRYLATCGRTSCYGVERAVVRSIFAVIRPRWPTSYPNSGGSRVGGGRWRWRSLIGFEGGADDDRYGAQERAERRSFPMSAAVAEWLLQCSGVRLRSQACARTRGYGDRAVTVAGMATYRPSAPHLTCRVTGK
jgi:hypothetical protein